MPEDAPDPTDIKFVGPATAAVLADAPFDAADVRSKSVSFRMLLDAGVNPGVAARIRREHSLAWSFESEDPDDLRRRSTQVRGLGDAERAWVAAASDDWSDRDLTPADDGDGEAAWVAASVATRETEADGSGDPVAAESAWRERSRPTPLTELDGVDGETIADLAEAGITSVRSLSTADPEEVAEALDRNADRVTALRDAASEFLG